ncbi:ABC transporter ATP-binding protein [Candidatus Fermentibacterales bacterium]|nr:ABC transporter ATP-binding protein [Candidatus Fermentibacterales bacterium]
MTGPAREDLSGGAPAVLLREVSFQYGSLASAGAGHQVLRDVDLRVEQGDYIAILGPNGGGKTTLLRLILGLVRPSSGSVRVFGRDPSQALSLVGYVPQLTTSAGDFPASVLEVVLMGRIGHGGPRGGRRRDRETALEMMSRLGISELASESVSSLSGGQRQRMLIARALVGSPRLLLLDEPVASVDSASQDSVYTIFHELNESGVTILMVTHDVGAVSTQIKSIACMNVQLFRHGEKLLEADLARAYGCPVDLITHGVPHRVLGTHSRSADDQ